MKLFMEPSSVAIIGVPRQTGQGVNLVEHLQGLGYDGRIYPINPHISELLGLKVYASILEVPQPVDLAVVLTHRSTVLPVVADCVQKGIRAIVVSAGGFAELDSEGQNLQAEMVRLARQGSARIVGPNTFGVANAFHNFTSAFAHFEMKRVPVGMVCQSGLFFAGLPGLGLGKVIDLVNACDVDFSDALEYYEQDEDVRVILLHMEGVRNGRRFMEVARRAAARKPVIALKAGTTDEGSRVARTHSASITGSSDVYRALFRSCGLITVEDMQEMADAATALLRLPPMSGPRVAVMTFTIGGVVLFVDACQRWGLELARLSAETKAQIKDLFLDWAPVENPVDLGAVFALSGQSQGEEFFTTLLAALLQDSNVDAVVFMSPTLLPFLEKYSRMVTELKGRYGNKPVVSWIIQAGGNTDETVVNFDSAERVARALGHLWQYSRRQATAAHRSPPSIS
jgi:acetyltransferase